MQNTDVARRIELGPTRSTRGRRLYHPYKRTPSPLAQRRPRDAAWDVPGADWTSAVAVVEEAARDGVLDAFEYTALWHRLNPGLPNADAQEHVAQGGEAGAFKTTTTTTTHHGTGPNGASLANWHDVDGDEEAGAVLQAAMAPHAGVPVRPAFVRRRLATVIIDLAVRLVRKLRTPRTQAERIRRAATVVSPK